jgi:hypothetical protein
VTSFRIHVASEFSDLPERALALIAAAPSYDLTAPYLEAMARHTLAPGERVQLVWLGAGADDVPAALLPLVRNEPAGLPLHRRSVRALANYYNGCFAPLVTPAADPALVVNGLAQALVTELGPWESLDLNPLDTDAPLVAALADRLRRRRCFVQRYFRFGNWYLDVAGRSCDEYLESLPSRLRNTLKRKGRKLEQQGNATYEVLATEEGLDATLDEYERVYARSWKQGESYPLFIRDVAHAFVKRGWLRLGVLRIAGEAAATQLWFVYNRTASIFKLAYDPRYTEHSVGSLLTAHLMRHVIDVDRVDTVDYLSGDDDYKKDWMSARRERWGLRVYRWGSVAGLAGAARSLAGELARRGLNRMRRASSREGS